MSKIAGFDFGTTNSVMSMVVGERCISLLDDRMPHPSVVCYHGSEIIVGRKARERLGSADAGIVGNVVKSPKTLLGRSSVNIDGYSHSPRQVVAEVVKHVRADAQRQMDSETFDRAVVTVPVDMDGSRRRELRDACRIAGLSIVRFVHEPLAALYGHLRGHEDSRNLWRSINRKLVLVFDWGGGTLDLTLCRLADGVLVQLMNDGCSDVGGDVIDDMLVREIERLTLAERGVTHSVDFQVGARPRLRAAAETAKVQLSAKDVHTVLVTDYFSEDAGDPDIAIRFGRNRLEQCVAATVDAGVRRIHQLLERARVDPASIEMCLATGGMVNMPLIQARLHEIFGPQRVHVSPKGNTIISEGAAWIAHDGARLSLAKNVEVLVARKDYFPVVKAGSAMPREGEVFRQELSMYCADPRDGIARFEMCAPKRTGRAVQKTDERDTLGFISVNVDAQAQPLRERLVLDVAIDENLILSVTAASTVRGDSDRAEFHELEFGLAIDAVGDDRLSEGDGDEVDSADSLEPGSVLLRANVFHRQTDQSVIPGELMRELNPHYFDLRNRPPAVQDYEKLVYQPCSACRQVRCECAQLRAETTNGRTQDGARPR
jgi:molecular chaperone DnaK